MKNRIIVFIIFNILLCACLTTCSNSIMEKWWEEPQTAGMLRPLFMIPQQNQPAVEGRYVTVTFEANGGEPIPGNQNIAQGGKIAKVPSMINGLNGFDGWYRNYTPPDTYSSQWDFANDTVGVTNITLYAKWAALAFTITFHTKLEQTIGTATGDIVEELLLEPQYIVAGGKITEPAAIRYAEFDAGGVRKGFAGWYTEDTYVNLWNFDTPVAGNMDLHAKWDPSYREVKFQPNGGSPAPINQDVCVGYKVVEPLAINREGYGFGGWYTDPGFNNLWNFNDPVNTNMTLYAKWVTMSFTVTFNPDGGNPAPGNQTVIYGSKITQPQVMHREHYGFGGWYKEDLSTLWDFLTDTVTADMTLYAKWEKGAFTVTFNDNYVTPPAAQHILEGAKAVEPPPRTREFFTFDGWYKDADNDGVGDFTLNNWWDFNEDTITDDIILYARWVEFAEDEESWIPSGAFIMGDNTVSGAKPAHKVRVSGFYMYNTLVTQAEYTLLKDYMDDGELNETGINPSHFNWESGDLLPVECVSWYDAIEYCNIRSEIDRFEPVYYLSNTSDKDPRNWSAKGSGWDTVQMDPTADGYRLPTEAEWEYAARGGNGTPGNYIYSGSNNVDEVAWYMDNSDATHPVGEKKPNSFGIYDMSGNVYEWCWDWYDADYYAYCYEQTLQPVSNPTGPATPGTRRVRRGGCWSNTSANVRSVVRQSFPPDNATYVMGIRIIRCPVDD